MTSLAESCVLEKQCRYLPSNLSSSSFRLLREGFFTRKDFGISPWRPRVVLHTNPTTHLAIRQLRRGIPPSCLRWRYQQISFPSIRVSPTTPKAAPSLNVLLILRREHARARTRFFQNKPEKPCAYCRDKIYRELSGISKYIHVAVCYSFPKPGRENSKVVDFVNATPLAVWRNFRPPNQEDWISQ